MSSVTSDTAGETAAVTGGCSGVGRAIALAFVRAGVTVINADVGRDPKDAADVTGELLPVDGDWQTH